MIKYRNDFGCSMNFDEEILIEEVEKRLSWMGSGWRKVEESNSNEEQESLHS